jgi:hypothetical protein
MAALVLDHLLVVGDVDRLTRDVQAAVGAAPDDGGSHPGAGTRNAIFAARDACALEAIGPEPAGAPMPAWGPQDVAEGTAVLWWWAARVDGGDPRAIRDDLADLGIATSPPERGERIRPDGDRVAWEIVDLVEHPYGTTLPFVIRWIAGTPPWALASSPACRIRDFRLGHPDAAGLATVLATLGLDVPVDAAAAPTLSAELAGPAGAIGFASR